MLPEPDPVSRGRIGILFGETPTSGGVLVAEAFSGQPAQQSGMMNNDIVTHINDIQVTDSKHFSNLVRFVIPVGKSTKFSVNRNGKVIKLNVSPIETNKKDSKEQERIAKEFRDGPIDKDLTNSARWFQASAKQGNDNAMNWLGFLYDKGSRGQNLGDPHEL